MATIWTHNGKFTIKSTATGEHRTFRVKTQAENAPFAPGKRILSLLIGSDNVNNYQQFAFVDEFGVHVWTKKRTPQYLAFKAMLENLTKHEEAGRVEVFAETTCRRCNRVLTDPISVTTGIGPICEEYENGHPASSLAR